MRFLLYNIRYGAGTGAKFHFPLPYSGYLKRTGKNFRKIVKFIQSHKPDIVGLLEVDGGSFRSRRVNQAAEIADALGHYHVYQSKYPASSISQTMPLLKNQGNAFLTSENIKDQKYHYFTKGVKRLVIELELRDLTIFLVHLSLKYRHRQYQLSDLYDIIKEVEKPVIVAGDLNVFWGDKELQLFLGATGLINANREGRPSYRSRVMKKQLDFILHSPEIEVGRFEIPDVKLSDHLPLICDFEVVSQTNTAGQKAAALNLVYS